jgi:Leucine-rich repeat (LRR) protein
LLSCKSRNPEPVLQSLRGNSDVKIYLSEYNLENVPKEIGTLKGVKRLYISKDTIQGWTIYPPLSALGQNKMTPPFKHLPKEITQLTTLQTLTLVNLDLVTLPDDMYKLENLDSLILFMNKLTISNELNKLKSLKRLRYLGLLGNNVTADDLDQLKKSIPGVAINPELR